MRMYAGSQAYGCSIISAGVIDPFTKCGRIDTCKYVIITQEIAVRAGSVITDNTTNGARSTFVIVSYTIPAMDGVNRCACINIKCNSLSHIFNMRWVTTY